MQWWSDFLDWASTGEGLRTLAQTALPFLAIVLAGIIAAVIGRAAIRHSLGLAEQELTRGVLAAVIGAGRQYAVWDTLTTAEQQYAAIAAAEAEVRLRMLPRVGAEAAADWALHELEELKRNSIDFGRSSEAGFAEFRDRLVEWHFRPRKARKLFLQDLERWRFERSEENDKAADQQRKWQQEQQTRPAPTASDLANRLAARDQERASGQAPTQAAPVATASTATASPATGAAASPREDGASASAATGAAASPREDGVSASAAAPATAAPAPSTPAYDEPAPVPTSLPGTAPQAAPADANATAPYQPVATPRPSASSVTSPADATDTGVVVEATDPPKSAFGRNQD
ncbi:hypothetical protein [Arenivirga flava]|uniref:Uncharacterized protein n=1 Tax=Arenivirga flava TaxID=1930060 RepID=A0AA37ULA8_9MICO|nr:hypothetical protein [Arenivirga flava]GMA28587.1 hypothetical protein GCM10025874_18400 [Arenivirga flava]